MEPLRIDQKKCNKDGICVEECPARIILKDSKDDFPRPAAEFKEFCLRCGHCVAVCPTKALSLDWLGPEECPPVKKELDISPDQAEQFLRARRSFRTFKDKPIEREKLEKLLEIACYAPSAKNVQPWHWLVIEDPAEVRRLAGLVVEFMRIVIDKNPEAATKAGFQRAVASWDTGYDRICRGAPCVIVAHADKTWGFGAEDCTLAISYLDLYSPMLGLAGCWGGYFYSAANNYPPLFQALGLPADHKVFGAIMMGYPKFTYQRLPLRNAPRVTWK